MPTTADNTTHMVTSVAQATGDAAASIGQGAASAPHPSVGQDVGASLNPANWWKFATGQDLKQPKAVKDLGEFLSTAYGPPWDSMEGTGKTKDGTDLTNAPHKYVVAVDPSIIKLGSYLLIWPNPHNYKGTFKAADTGGAIQGRHIDFYVWQDAGSGGHAFANQWGSRNVNVKITNQGDTVAGPVSTVAGAAATGIDALVSPIRAIADFFTTLFSMKLWVTIGKLVGGFILIGIALYMMLKSTGVIAKGKQTAAKAGKVAEVAAA